MHAIRITLTASVLFLAGAAQAACYQVFAPDGNVVYRSMEAPVDLSKPLHETMPQAAPGGRLVFALDYNGCELEIHKLDVLHKMAAAAAKSPRKRAARKAKGA